MVFLILLNSFDDLPSQVRFLLAHYLMGANMLSAENGFASASAEDFRQ